VEKGGEEETFDDDEGIVRVKCKRI